MKQINKCVFTAEIPTRTLFPVFIVHGLFYIVSLNDVNAITVV
jgi:hypothetical protein